MMPIHFKEVWQMMGAWRESRIHTRLKKMSKMWESNVSKF